MTTLIPKFDLMNGGTTPVGAVNRPINLKLEEAISVKDFGAVGDGVTDDTVAIQNCLNSFTQATGGGTVLFPPGTYIISASLIVDVHGMTIVGTKGSTWVKRANGVAPDTMNLLQTGYQGRYTPGAQIFDFTMVGMGFDGNKANNTMGVDDNFDEGVSLLYASRCFISDCYVKNVLRIGMPLSTQANDSTVQGCVFQDCDEGGLYAEVSSNVTFVGNIIKDCSTVAFNIGAISMNRVVNGSITGNTVIGGEDGIYIRNLCNNIAVTGNAVYNPLRYGFWSMDESQTGSNSPTNITLTGNTFYGTGSYACYLWLVNNVTITGNIFNCSNVTYAVLYRNGSNQTFSANNYTGWTTAPLYDYGGNTYTSIDSLSGTYTPTIVGTTTAGVGTYTAQSGRYSYQGNRVQFSAVITTTAHTGTGSAKILLPLFASLSEDIVINMTIYGTTYTGYPVATISGAEGTYGVISIVNGATGGITNLAIPAAATYQISGTYQFK